MMRKVALLSGLVILTFISINFAFPKKESRLIGTYKSKHYNLLQRGFNYYILNCLLIDYGSELKLYPDSTFLSTNTGNIMTGKWRATQDTLYLKILTNRFRNDSLNRTGQNGRFLQTGGTMKFEISGNKLTRDLTFSLCSDSTKKFNAFEAMVKAED